MADPDGPWQLELHMPENRMGHIVEAQQALYEQSREKLREHAREEDTRAKLGEAADRAEDVDKAVGNRRWPTVPDEKLRDRILAAFRQRLDEPAASRSSSDVTDEELRAKLGEVLREESYDGARAQVAGASCRTWRPRTPTCAAKLQELPQRTRCRTIGWR